MKRLALFAPAAAALLAGCSASELISDRGTSLTYRHDSDLSTVMDVYADAAARCKAQGLIAQQTSTACPGRCVTSFACIKR